MSKKEIPERQRLAAIFASFSILIMGALSLVQSMSLDYYSVLNTLEKVVPASIILGGLGWIMGMILDKPKKRNKISYNSLFVKDLTKSDKSTENSENIAQNLPVTE